MLNTPHTEIHAGILDPNAPTLEEHLQISREQGKVEPAYIKPGPHLSILVGLDGNSTGPDEPLLGAIHIEGLLISSTPNITGMQGTRRLDSVWITAMVEGDYLAQKAQFEETGKKLPTPLTYDSNEEIPDGEIFNIITQAHLLASELTYKHKKGILKTREALAYGPKLLSLQRKATRFSNQRKKQSALDE